MPKKPVHESEAHPHRRRLVVGSAVAGLILVVLVAWLSLSKRAHVRQEAATLARQQAEGPRVEVAKVRKTPPEHDLILIGETRPYLATSLFARVSGFLTEVRVDKGDQVQAGQVLAVIESPETDKAYYAALSDWTNKQHIAEREKVLRKRNLISQQELEQTVATAEVARATLQTQEVLRSYEKLQAPFAGIITARYQDPGALVQNASAAQGSSPAVFDIAETDPLRVYGYVEQSDADTVHPGQEAEITLPEGHASPVRSSVTRVASALDPKTRTMLAEIDVENPDNRIISGSFVQLRIRIPNPQRLEIPAKALVQSGDHKTVPVVAQDRTLHFQNVVVAGSDGEFVQIVSGLEEGQTVALGASIYREGTKIQPAEAQLAGQGASTGKGK